MLSQPEIDQLEGYLCKATLNDLPNVLMKVLPRIFAELRTMQRALDTQAEEFFSARVPPDDTGRRATTVANSRGEGGVPGSPQETPLGQAPRTEVSVGAVHPRGEVRQAPTDTRGLRGTNQLGTEPVVTAGVGLSVGGAVGESEGHRSATGGEQNVVLKRRRGKDIKPRARRS